VQPDASAAVLLRQGAHEPRVEGEPGSGGGREHLWVAQRRSVVVVVQLNLLGVHHLDHEVLELNKQAENTHKYNWLVNHFTIDELEYINSSL
jgi:hypothetical protein